MQSAQNVCKAYQSGNSFCLALCCRSSLLSLSIKYCLFIKIPRIIVDTKALYTSTHCTLFVPAVFYFMRGGHANLARRETFTHVEPPNKKLILKRSEATLRDAFTLIAGHLVFLVSILGIFQKYFNSLNFLLICKIWQIVYF